MMFNYTCYFHLKKNYCFLLGGMGGERGNLFSVKSLSCLASSSGAQASSIFHFEAKSPPRLAGGMGFPGSLLRSWTWISDFMTLVFISGCSFQSLCPHHSQSIPKVWQDWNLEMEVNWDCAPVRVWDLLENYNTMFWLFQTISYGIYLPFSHSGSYNINSEIG